MGDFNKAIFVDKRSKCSVRNIPIPEPGENEVLVKVLYTGMNPADLRHPKYLGIRDTVIGDDFCGRVVWSRSSKFRKGDLIAGYTPVIIPRPAKYGTYQSYLCCPDNMCYKVPENLPKEEAAALTVVAMTAADAIFNHFRLPLPTDTKKKVSGPLLIWGASTSVGLCALHYARASNCKTIIVTASSERHQLLYKLGATICFDYSSPTVIQDIQHVLTETNQGPLAYAFDAVGSQRKPTSADQIRRCATNTTILASVIHQFSRRFKFPTAVTFLPFQLKPFGLPFKLTTPARPEDHWRAWGVLSWTIANYGPDGGFLLPKVTVLEGTGEEILRKAQDVAEGKGGFGKFVIKQPFY
ncbi:chaperonin 10-like protein [Aspergillus nidulans var. acristatus]